MRRRYAALIKSEFDLYALQNRGRRVTGNADALALLQQHLLGLCEEDVKRLISLAIRDDGELTMADIARVLKSKQEMLADGTLEIEIDTGRMDQIGGMANLKRWLTQRRAVFAGEAAAQGLDTPRGVLLLGVQGAGKSLAAKTIAGAWGVPLLRLDFAALYNKFHGETERNLRAVLQSADAMAPCVLWIDEIEKGLAGERRFRRRRVAPRARHAADLDGRAQVARLHGRHRQRHLAAAARAAAQGPLRRDLLRRSARGRRAGRNLPHPSRAAPARRREVRSGGAGRRCRRLLRRRDRAGDRLVRSTKRWAKSSRSRRSTSSTNSAARGRSRW